MAPLLKGFVPALAAPTGTGSPELSVEPLYSSIDNGGVKNDNDAYGVPEPESAVGVLVEPDAELVPVEPGRQELSLLSATVIWSKTSKNDAQEQTQAFGD
jgi:hypothetical protein